MISNESSEGNGVAVKDSKHHDGVDEGSMEVSLKSKKKTNSGGSSVGKGVVANGSKRA